MKDESRNLKISKLRHAKSLKLEHVDGEFVAIRKKIKRGRFDAKMEKGHRSGWDQTGHASSSGNSHRERRERRGSTRLGESLRVRAGFGGPVRFRGAGFLGLRWRSSARSWAAMWKRGLVGRCGPKAAAAPVLSKARRAKIEGRALLVTGGFYHEERSRHCSGNRKVARG